MVGLVGTVDGHVKVLSLGVGEGGELDVELRQMGTSDFLVELLGEHAVKGNQRHDRRERAKPNTH